MSQRLAHANTRRHAATAGEIRSVSKGSTTPQGPGPSRKQGRILRFPKRFRLELGHALDVLGDEVVGELLRFHGIRISFLARESSRRRKTVERNAKTAIEIHDTENKIIVGMTHR